MTIAIYGGSFNPPHLGHRAVALAVMEQLRPDRLLIMPDRVPPHKELPEKSPSPAERAQLCRLCFGDVPGVEISELELGREGASYTADTVELLRREWPEARLFLVVGTDMLLCFEQWRRSRYLMANCALAAACRDERERASVEEKAAQLRRDFGAEVCLLRHEALPVSSEQLRERLPRREGAELLYPPVYAEIIRRRYYGAQVSLDWLRERAFAYLKPRRVPHVRGCEETARRLAARYGENEALAAEAAILHDATKALDTAGQLALCERYGLTPRPEELQSPQVLHAITAAALARDEFGVSDEVAGAIRWHCTGKEDMSRLEKIVWLADYIEPTRQFPGVEDVRALAEEDLDLALLTALRMTLRHVREQGETPCPVTERAARYTEERIKNENRRKSIC